MKKYVAWFLLLALLLTGCGKQEIPNETNMPPTGNTTETTPDNAESVSVDIDVDSLFSDRDLTGDYKNNKPVAVTLQGDSAVSESAAAQASGNTVTVTAEGVYVLSGEFSGSIVVDAPKTDKVQLVLNGATVTNPTGAAIYVRQADKVFITLAEGSENTLENGGSFVAVDENDIDGAVFSKEDLTLNGAGSLTVTSPVGHAVVSKDELKITAGSYQLQCAEHGLAGKDNVCIAGGSVIIAAGKDGIHAENNDDAAKGFVYIADGSFDITAEGDGISAGTAMQIDGGTFRIVAGGGSVNAQKPTSNGWGNMGGFGGMPGGMPGGSRPSKGQATNTASTTTDTDSTSLKGVKAGGALAINGGSFTVDAADDGIHSNKDITVTGGSFQIATGDDGFHADENLTVAAGNITITESYEGLEALHVNVEGGNITLTASDDGINAAGGKDESGFGGIRGDQFGGGGRPPMGGFGGGDSGTIVISGGRVNISASGDGLDANGTFEITGGDTVICGPTQGDTAVLDYDVGGTITGGTFIGTGSMGMGHSFSDAQQGVISVRVNNIAANTELTLTDSQGNIVLRRTPGLSYALVILSSPQIQRGQTYTLTIGNQSRQVQAS